MELNPGNLAYLNTLGVALYRNGKLREAVEVLTRSDQKRLADTKEAQPADLAFLALAQLQLGSTDEAKAQLERLRELMKSARWAKSAEAKAFLREVEQAFKGVPP